MIKLELSTKRICFINNNIKYKILKRTFYKLFKKESEIVRGGLGNSILIVRDNYTYIKLNGEETNYPYEDNWTEVSKEVWEKYKIELN